jgi:transposase
MKSYSIDLRTRIVEFVLNGASKVEAARRFRVARRTVYRYLEAQKNNSLAPKTSWGTWRKLDPDKLTEHVRLHPDDTLAEIKRVLKVSHNAIWHRLKKMDITLKKTHKISRTR